ncbi:hypothetical protein E2320_015913 [Naja naja]|nr:hypothetical protein E2320_015913 [Naja naja]
MMYCVGRGKTGKGEKDPYHRYSIAIYRVAACSWNRMSQWEKIRWPHCAALSFLCSQYCRKPAVQPPIAQVADRLCGLMAVWPCRPVSLHATSFPRLKLVRHTVALKPQAKPGTGEWGKNIFLNQADDSGCLHFLPYIPNGSRLKEFSEFLNLTQRLAKKEDDFHPGFWQREAYPLTSRFGTPPQLHSSCVRTGKPTVHKQLFVPSLHALFSLYI